ncbi:MAG: 6-phosphogluconolactonase [Verrucomicrobia bacterium]|nr:6-phosphogluconolactonase [Verrucomicrobiota bacterium]
MSNWELKQCANPTALAEQGAAEMVAWAASSPVPINVAVSGGRIAKDFFSGVLRIALTRKQSLAHVHFFWADERCVPPDHAESNYRSAAESLFMPLGLQPQNIHRIRGEDDPEHAARETQKELCRFASLNAAGQPVLDLVLLGMGEDGHVASLFPGEAEDVISSPVVYRAVTASKPPPRRITLGYPAIAAARQVWVLASGAGKEAALRQSLASPGRTPLARVLKDRTQTRIFTDIAL